MGQESRGESETEWTRLFPEGWRPQGIGWRDLYRLRGRDGLLGWDLAREKPLLARKIN